MSTTDDIYELLIKYAQLRDLHLATYRVLTDVQDGLKSGAYNTVDMVNVVYVLREISKFGDDIRAECERVMRLAEKLCCVLYVASCDLDHTGGGPIRTGLATGTPKVRMAAALPNQRDEPDAYARLMKFYGINDGTLAADAVRPHWPGIVEHLTQLAEQGKPLPPGIDVSKTYPVYSVGIKPWRHIDETVRMLSERRTDAQRRELFDERTKPNTDED